MTQSSPNSLPVSVEFFPPKTPEGVEKLAAVRQQLYAIRPEYCSVTYGAGGSTQDGTIQTVRAILSEGCDAAPHFSCIGASKASVREQLAQFKADGIRRIVALRGDLPSGYGGFGEFRYASDLVAFIREETGDHFQIEVAAYPEMHPQARNPQADLQAYVTKVKAGADVALTQYFFNSDAYFRFGRGRGAGGHHPGRARHHADHQQQPVAALLGCLWRRGAALDPHASGRLWRRQGLHPGFRAGRGHRAVRAAAQRGRAGPALLHDEPGCAGAGHL